jgi:DNA-binding GntR family transcriptional regulator
MLWRSATSDANAAIAIDMTKVLLQPQALCEKIAERIREQILCRALQPGDPINESAVIAQHEVSRTPVREALRLLQSEGPLTAQVRRGMMVTVLSTEQHEEAGDSLISARVRGVV